MPVVRLNSTHVEKIAKLHVQGIQTGFISSLGVRFVTELYKAIAESQTSFGFVEQENGVIRGLCSFHK